MIEREKSEAVTVRAIRTGDVEAVIHIDGLISGERKAGFWRGMLGAYLSEEAGAQGELSPELCQVAEAGGQVIGFMIGDIQSYQFGIPRCGRIVTVGVHPEHRRRDVGTHLIKAMFDVFRRFRVPFIQCLVRPDDPLRAFFGANGFREVEFFAMEREP